MEEERRQSHLASSTSGKLGLGQYPTRPSNASSNSPSGSPYRASPRAVPGQARRFAKHSRKESPFTGELAEGVPPQTWKERIGERVYGSNGLNETNLVTVDNGNLIRVSSTSRVMVSSNTSTVRIDQTTLVQLNHRPSAEERFQGGEGEQVRAGGGSQSGPNLAVLGQRSQSLPVERSEWEDPGSPPVRQPLDKFGFFTPPPEEQGEPAADGKKVEKREKTEREREERRLRKWRKMIGAGGMEWKHYCKKKPLVVKRRIRKGIPDCLRGLVWQLVSGSRDLLLQSAGVYEQLVFYETSQSELDIIRDISRTFPSHVFYSQRHGPGQRSLYNVLKAYSVYDKEVGYVQGMGFLAGLLLLYMGEEDAFWLLVALLKGAVHAPMEGLFLVGLPLVQQYLFQFERLVQELFPRLGAHFEEENINPSMYASQWFITVFSYSFPFSLALRIWDVFLSEGMKIVFRVGLALLKQCHDDLLRMPFEKLVHALRNFPDELLDPDTLLPIAYSIKVSARLAQLKEEYDRLHNPQPPAPLKAAEESEKASDGNRDLARYDSKEGSFRSGSKSSDSLGE